MDGYYLGWDNASCTAIPSYANCAQVVNNSTFARASSAITAFGGPDRCVSCNTGFAPALTPGVAAYAAASVNPDPCVACGANCASCNATNTSQCLSCNNGSGSSSGYFLATNACASQCSTANCMTCPTAIGTCGQCNGGYFTNGTLCSAASDSNCNVSTGQYMGSCTSCNTGYVKTAQQCFVCSKNGGTSYAATCSPPPQDASNNDINVSMVQILTCLPGSWLTIVCNGPVTGCTTLASPNICTPTGCSPGYFYNNATGTNVCVACSTGCLTCPNASYCSACNPVGYVLISNACTACTSPCANCTTNATTCTGCVAGYSLTTTNTCTACTSTGTTATCNCGSGTYWSGTACAACITGCNVCSTATTCTACFNNYYLDSNTNKCVAATDPNCDTVYYGISTGSLSYCKTCTVGYYYNSPSAICSSCSAAITNCAMCGSATACSVCATGYFLASGNCTACNLTKCGACSTLTKCIMLGWILLECLCNSCLMFCMHDWMQLLL